MLFWNRYDQLDRIENNIAKIMAKLQILNQGEIKMSAELDALTAQVAQNATVEASAITLIQGLAAQIAAAVANNDHAALANLTTELQNSANALATAITVNTPSANTANN